MSRGVLLLAAGRGERLRPVTDSVPKPLVKVRGIPMIAFPLYSLVKAGFRRIVVNTYHLADVLEEFLRNFGRINSIDFMIIRERRLLGTGGTIRFVFENFSFDEILVSNSDVMGDFDIAGFLSEAPHDSVAHVLLYRDSRTGGVQLNGGRVSFLGEGRGGDFVFCGVHLVRRSILDVLPKDRDSPVCIVRDGYVPAVIRGLKISYSVHRGFFLDLGTLERIAEGHRASDELFQKVMSFFVFP